MRPAAFILAATVALAGCSGEADAAKKLVANRLRDPSSAQFRNVQVVKQQDGTSAVCGEVNGKNAYGGYVGFQSFVVKGSEVHLRGNDFDFSSAADLDAQTAAIRANTQYCVLKGQTLAEVEAETARILEQVEKSTH